jgi:alpha-tubulin suppressor-like RCC1 family protein
MPRFYYALPGFVLLVALASCSEPTTTEPDKPQVEEPALATAASALSFYQVSGGNFHTCGVTTDSRLYCWGRNFYGELGDGTTTDRLKPVPVATTLRFREVSAGNFFNCALTTDYRAYCWGWNGMGGLGDGTTTNRLKPVAVAGGRRFRQITTGSYHTCAVGYTDNRGYCWGSNSDGQAGDGTTTGRLRPVAVAAALSYRQVSAGSLHMCGVTTDNRAFCWGNNREGQIGDRSEVPRRLRPTLVADG